MSVRSVFLILVGGVILIALGGFGAVVLLTSGQCGSSTYLCDLPSADAVPALAEHPSHVVMGLNVRPSQAASSRIASE
jgi:hypothetical protein